MVGTTNGNRRSGGKDGDDGRLIALNLRGEGMKAAVAKALGKQ